jgi:myo-inositol-1(or 4)-monophosphatase
MEKAKTDLTLARIREALEAAGETLVSYVPGTAALSQKSFGRGPVTEADGAANQVLRKILLQDGEGWLSEESPDGLDRLEKTNLWIVDPLDGTREFIAGIPEWCVSVAWIERGRAVAGGIYNPVTRELFLGSLASGVTYNERRVRASERAALAGGIVLASRSEVARGEWNAFQDAPFTVRPTGSIAYKLALVSAGLADATWTLSPKHEWDIAAGTALVEAGGGTVRGLEGSPMTFNQESTLLTGVVASGVQIEQEIARLLGLYNGANPAHKANVLENR